jgi:hypothetical protein
MPPLLVVLGETAPVVLKAIRTRPCAQTGSRGNTDGIGGTGQKTSDAVSTHRTPGNKNDGFLDMRTLLANSTFTPPCLKRGPLFFLNFQSELPFGIGSAFRAQHPDGHIGQR